MFWYRDSSPTGKVLASNRMFRPKNFGQGTLAEILGAKHSITGEYLSGRARIAVPKHRVAPRSNDNGRDRPPLQEGWLTILGANENNLKNVSAFFPLGCFICV